MGDGEVDGVVVEVGEGEETIRLTRRHLIRGSRRRGKRGGGLGSGLGLQEGLRRGIWLVIEGIDSKRRGGMVGGLEVVGSRSLEGAGGGWGEVGIVTGDLAGQALGGPPVQVPDMRVRVLDRRLEDRWCIHI